MKNVVLLRPDSQSRAYARYVKSMLIEMRQEIRAVVALRHDDETDENSRTGEAITAALLLWWRKKKIDFDNFVKSTFGKINLFNDKQFRKMVQKISGIILPAAPSTLSVLPVKEYVRLITPTFVALEKLGQTADIQRQETFLPLVEDGWRTIQNGQMDQYVNKIITDIQTGFKNGVIENTALSVLTAKAIETVVKAESRMLQFTASQITKVDNQLSMFRQKALGATRYVWKTCLDEHVRGNPSGKYPRSRPSHYARQDQIFAWNDPPAGGHPGQADGCRCWAVMLPTNNA